MILLFVASCAETPETEVDSSELQPKAKAAGLKQLEQPSSDPDDEALLADDRERLSNLSGELMPPQFLAAAFPEGKGVWHLGAEPRTDDKVTNALYRYVRWCNKVSGCTAWGKESMVLEYQLRLFFDGDQLSLEQRDNSGRLITTARITGNKTPVTLAAHLSSKDNIDTRRFLVEIRQDGVVIETLIRARDLPNEQQQWMWAAEFPLDLSNLPPRQPTDTLPEIAHTLVCTDDAASQAQLADWFADGAITVALTNAENFGWRRECHELTGCTRWETDETKLMHELVVRDDKVAVRTSAPEEFRLTDSRYDEDRVHLLVGPSCARGVAHRASRTAGHSWLDRYGSGIAIRASQPGDQ